MPRNLDAGLVVYSFLLHARFRWVNPEPLGQAHCHRPHQMGGVTIKPIDETRKIQGLLEGPDCLVTVRRQDMGRVANGDPADRHRSAWLQAAAQMHGAVDPDFRSGADNRPVKDSSPGGNEAFVACSPFPFGVLTELYAFLYSPVEPAYKFAGCRSVMALPI
jgi:hypothetical protein